MESTIKLECEVHRLADYLGGWLERLDLSPPKKLTLRVSAADSKLVSEDERPAFRQPAVAIRTGPPHDDVRISWTVAPALAIIPRDATEAEVLLSPEAAERPEELLSTFFIIVLIFLLRRAGWHHVHAATAIDPQGRGWLVAGDARAGKSTMAALLASRGWSVGADDTAFIVREDDRVAVHAARTLIALRRGGYTLLGRDVGTLHVRRSKMVSTVEELGGAWLPRVEPDILLFTTVGDRVSEATPIGRRESLTELIRWSAWVALEPELAQDHLDLLRELAQQAQGYRVTLGRDLFQDPDRLMELIP